jgi:autotransporter-associated beta strand protein
VGERGRETITIAGGIDVTICVKLFQDWGGSCHRRSGGFGAGLRSSRVGFRLMLAALVLAAPLSPARAGDWTGYMSVFENNAGTQGAPVFGSAWGVSDLKTTVLARPGTGISVDNNILELFPNYNTYTNAVNNTDPVAGPEARSFWTNSTDGGVTPGPNGNKWMEASTFVEDPSITQDSVTFSGRIDSYTLSSNYTAEAFIKVLDPNAGYSQSYYDSVDLSGRTDFSLTADTLFFPGLLLQMGFAVKGINANPDDAATLGSVRVTTSPTPEPPPIEWVGFMNVFEKTAGGGQGTYVFSDNWGVADVKTSLISVDPTTLTDNQLELFPNFNAYTDAVNNTDPDAGPVARSFWTDSTDGGITAGPDGNKWMNANTLVEDSIVDQTATTFTGRIDAYTLSSEYAAEAYIRVLDPADNYSESFYQSQNLSGVTDFTLSADLSSFTGQILQRGFSVNGVNANPADAAALGSVLVTVNPSTGPTAIVIDVASGSQTQSQAGYPTIASATSVTKTGAGTVVFDAANAYTGPTTISAGTLEVADADAVASSGVTVASGATLAIASGTTMKAPSVTLAGGTLSADAVAVNGSTGIATLTINSGTVAATAAVIVGAGGLVDLPDADRVSIGVASLAVTETAGGGKIDLGSGQVSIAAGGIAAADLRADIIAGRNGGAWDGTEGISSAAAAASSGTRAVGYTIAGDGAARVSFASPGDTNIDGVVDLIDLLAILSSGTYDQSVPAIWDQGDFNYDGVTDLLDLLSILGSGTYDQGNYFPAAPAAAGFAGTVAAVPEPTGTILIGAAVALGLALARRRL